MTVTLTFETLFPQARAVEVKITSISPATRRGKVGDAISIAGTINKTDGLYRIWFDRYKIKETNATGNAVNATFQVPQIPYGNYTITLQDVENNVNDTSIKFYVESAFYVKAILMPDPPNQLQENSTVKIQLNVTGGAPNTFYSANVTVKVPTPAIETYWTLATLTNTTNTGGGVATVVYPDDFQGTPHTNYTGSYTIAFNKTWTNTFYIGLTNSTEYHRLQNVSIKAAGYTPNENATIKITFGGKVIDSIDKVNATEGGLVLATWPILRNASRGIYTVNITSMSLAPTRKNTPDIQNFTVPGFDVHFTTRNLAREIVPNVKVQVFEEGKSVGEANSTSNGLVHMKLEVGNYSCKAFYKGENVGEFLAPITNATLLDLLCNLTNLKISVIALVNGVKVGVPEVKIYFSPLNQVTTTNITGTVILHSLLSNRNYVLNISRYDKPPFNTTFIQPLPAKDWLNITVICPTVNLQVSAVDGQNRAIKEFMAISRESIGGLYYQNAAINGVAEMNCVIGKYKVEVYGKRDNKYFKLNETFVDLFEEKQISIICKVYSLNVSVRVIDYFGQPIPNGNISLQRETLQYSPSTESSGMVTFNNIIGGDLQLTVSLKGQATPCAMLTSFVDSSRIIEIKLEKYVVLAGFLLETGDFATLIIIVATILLILLIEVHGKRRFKPQKNSS